MSCSTHNRYNSRQSLALVLTSKQTQNGTHSYSDKQTQEITRPVVSKSTF